MPRPKNKEELILASEEGYKKLKDFIGTMTENELDTTFDFSSLNKKEAHWNRDKNLRDVLAHLYEWHQLLLCWTDANLNGEHQPFLPEPYNWKTYGEMNIAFYNKHQSTDLTEISEALEESHKDVMNTADMLTDEQLFSKSFYKWTGTTSLGSYFISVTSSHYEWALKKLKAHRKIIGGK